MLKNNFKQPAILLILISSIFFGSLLGYSQEDAGVKACKEVEELKEKIERENGLLKGIERMAEVAEAQDDKNALKIHEESNERIQEKLKGLRDSLSEKSIACREGTIKIKNEKHSGELKVFNSILDLDAGGDNIINIGQDPKRLQDLFEGFFKRIFEILFAISGTLVVLAISIQGFQIIYQSAKGNPIKYKDAKDGIVTAFGGLILLLLSYVILNTINPDLLSLRSYSDILIQSNIYKIYDGGSPGTPKARTRH